MLDKVKHQLMMGKILKDIYTDISISPLLGFKGGTCAYFFYNLSRFSVDLDFDLLKNDKQTQSLVFNKVKSVLEKYGKVKDEKIKKFTIFFLLSYGEDEHNIKIEINIRKLPYDLNKYYDLKEYLGISMLVAKPEFMFSNKLIALVNRKETAVRDIYDIYHFFNNNWNINEEIIELWTKQKLADYLKECSTVIEKIKPNELLRDLGELVDEKRKNWIKTKLKEEVIYWLKNYILALSR